MTEFKIKKGHQSDWRNLQFRVDPERIALFKKIAKDHRIGTSELFAQMFDFAVEHMVKKS